MRDNTIVRLNGDLKDSSDLVDTRDNTIRCFGEQLKRLQDDIWQHMDIFHPGHVEGGGPESRSLGLIRVRPTYL